jgi:hypothetical protein
VITVDPKKFAPYDIGDRVIMLNQQGAIKETPGYSNVYQVTGVERLPVLGKRGVLAVWAHDDTSVPGGVSIDPGIEYGELQDSGGSLSPQIQSLNPLQGQLIVWRTLSVPLGTLPGGLVAQDIDIFPSMPSSVSRWTLMQAQGYMNMVNQFQDPSDGEVRAGSGTNQGVGNPSVSVDPFEEAYMSELAVYGQNNQPSYTIINDSASVASAHSMAWGLAIRGFLYNLVQLDLGGSPQGTGSGSGVTYQLGSADITLPTGCSWEQCRKLQVSSRQVQGQ